MTGDQLLGELFLRFRATTPELWQLHSKALRRRNRRIGVEVDGEVPIVLGAGAINAELRRRAARESGADAAEAPPEVAARLW